MCKNCYKSIKCKNRQLLYDKQPNIIVGISEIAGWGLFANEDIKKDVLIGEYKGELINEDITNKRDKFKMYENSTYMFTLDNEYTVDSRKMGNVLRYANHSKKYANAYPRVVFCNGHYKIRLFAKRHIYKGEEIKFDYDGQGVLSKQFDWINNEKTSKSDIFHYLKMKNKKKKLCLISKGGKKEKNNTQKNMDFNKSIKNDENDKYSLNINEKVKLENTKKENIKEEKNDNQNQNGQNKSRIIRIINDDENINPDNIKNETQLPEGKKDNETKENIINNNKANINKIDENSNNNNNFIFNYNYNSNCMSNYNNNTNFLKVNNINLNFNKKEENNNIINENIVNENENEINEFKKLINEEIINENMVNENKSEMNEFKEIINENKNEMNEFKKIPKEKIIKNEKKTNENIINENKNITYENKRMTSSSTTKKLLNKKRYSDERNDEKIKIKKEKIEKNKIILNNKDKISSQKIFKIISS